MGDVRIEIGDSLLAQVQERLPDFGREEQEG